MIIPHGMVQPAYLAISVDDGHPTDLRSAELLQKFGLKATFYIPARNPEREVMSEPLIRQLGNSFELGSHTYNHKPLAKLNNSAARLEISDGKKWLEDVVGAEITSFCYPRGKFHAGTINLVREVGFLGARTSMFNLNGFPRNPFIFGVSTHAYSHSAAVQIRHALLEHNLKGLVNYIFTHRLAFDWSKHFLHGIDHVRQRGGIAHLCFHSWEIHDQGEWNVLEKLLKTVSESDALRPVTNGELIKLWYERQHENDALR